MNPKQSLAGAVPKKLARTAAVGSLVFGAVVLAGWCLDVSVLESAWPDGPRLTANGALILMLLGLGLGLMSNKAGQGWAGRIRYGVGQSAALLAVVIGVVSLLQYLGGWNTGIDELLVKDPLAIARGDIPGRVSFPTALTAVWVGLGLILLDTRFGRIWPSQVLAVTSVLISFLALIGYACNLPEFYGQLSTHKGTGMPLPAVAGFLVLGVGLLCARAERGLMVVLWSHTPGGVLARWLILAPAVGLLLTGVVYLVLTQGVQVDRAIRIWALGLSNLIFVTVPIWVAAHALHQTGLRCDQAHQALDERVQQRTAELTQVNAALQAEIGERTQAETALRLSEERYRIVADNTYAMEYWVDPRGQFVYVSPSCERISGYTAAEFRADPALLERLVHPAHRQLLDAQRRSALEPGAAPEQIECRLRRRDGIEVWVAHHCRPLLGSLGEYLGQRASLRDVTARKQAEERTREERDFSDALVDSLPGVFYLFQAHGCLLRWNKNLERVTGYSGEEIAGMHPQDFFAGADQRLITERILNAFSKGEATAEADFVAKDGTRRPYFFTGTRVMLRGEPSLVGVGFDLTERRRAEQTVLDRERELRLVMDSGPTLIAYVNADGRYQRVNQTYTRWYGLSTESVHSRRIEEIVGDAGWRVIEPHVAQALAGEVVCYEQEVPLPGGSRWIQATYTPDRDAAGVVRGFIVHALDVTARRQAEDAVREARDRLESQAAELERRVAERTAKLRETIGDLEAFSYSVAHDMRAPLRGMQGFARLLLEEHAVYLKEEAQIYLERIASSAYRMDQLIQDALNYTCVLRAETPLKRLDVDRLVRHLVATYPDWQLPQADIRIEGTLPPALGHEAFLTQCISNLVGNAVKFVAPGTTPCVRIWAETTECHVRVWVEDNGIGIAAKDHDRIFHMFERVNRADEYEGTGIGLAIVRKAAERMGGRVDFESEVGKGSRFWIELQKAPLE